MAIAIKKTAAIAIAAGLTFAGSAGIVAQDALAQTTNTVAPSLAPDAPDASSIGDEKVKLTINKRVNPTELRNATGEADTASGDALAGVGFMAERIDLDITDQANFNKIAKFANDRDVAGARALGTEAAITFDDTDADGKTTKTLPVGAYIITETKTPDIEGAEAYVKADPFIVFLPMTNSKGDGWNRDVQVYPKNSYAKATKAVVDTGKHALNQDNVTYTLTGIVPSAKEGQKLDWFGLRDAYNNTEIEPDLGNITVKIVNADGETVVEKPNFAVGQDKGYGSNKNGEFATDANDGFFIGVNSSLLKPGDKVVATVNAKLLDGSKKNQEVENSVREYFRHSTDDSNFKEVPPETPPNTPPGDTPPTETPNDKVISYFGNIQVFKTGEEDGKRTALEGATFEVGKCDSTGKAFEGKAIATGTTGKDGTLTFEGLHVTDYADDAVIQDPGKYCLRETDAPAGYSFDKDAVYPLELKRDTKNGAQPANFTTGTAQKADYTAEGTKIMNGVAVNNIKRNVPLLPSTGGMGVLIIALAGLAIIGGGVYAARRNSQSA